MESKYRILFRKETLLAFSFLIIGILLSLNQGFFPTGLVVLEPLTQSNLITINQTFNETSTLQLNLTNLTSLKVTGTLTLGQNSTARILVSNENKNYTIVEVNNSNTTKIIKLESFCQDTCSLNNENISTLHIILDNATFFLDLINYTRSEGPTFNIEPTKNLTFYVNNSKNYTLNFSELFIELNTNTSKNLTFSIVSSSAQSILKNNSLFLEFNESKIYFLTLKVSLPIYFELFNLTFIVSLPQETNQTNFTLQPQENVSINITNTTPILIGKNKTPSKEIQLPPVVNKVMLKNKLKALRKLDKREIKFLDYITNKEFKHIMKGNKVQFLVRAQQISSNNITIKKKLSKNFYLIEASLDNLTLLNSLPTLDLYLNKPTKLTMYESMNITNITLAKQSFNVSGKNISICIVDSGVNNINYVKAYDFVENDAIPNDLLGHGTNVATIIKEVAPDSLLYVAKAFGNSSIQSEDVVLEALQWCIDQNPKIISLSLGTGLYDGLCDNEPLASLANNAFNQGILVLASSGNDGSLTSITSPACANHSIAVAASTKQDTVASFSNINNKTRILAPGQNINVNNQTVSGTSFAVPFVSSSLALLLEKNETFNLTLVELALFESGKKINYFSYNLSRLDVYSLLSGNYSLNTTLPSLNQSNQTNQSGNVSLSACVFYYEAASPPSCSSSNPCFILKDSSGNTRFIVDSSGNIEVFGTYYNEQSSISTGSNEFIIRNSAGTNVAKVTSSGYLYIKGCYTRNTGGCTPPTGSGNFIIKDSSGTVVFYIDSNGNMCAKGTIYIAGSAYCGNEICENTESTSTCSADCPPNLN